MACCVDAREQRSPREPKSRVTDDALITPFVTRGERVADEEKIRRIYDKVKSMEETQDMRHAQVVTLLQSVSKDLAVVLSLSGPIGRFSESHGADVQDAVLESDKVWLDDGPPPLQPDTTAAWDEDIARLGSVRSATFVREGTCSTSAPASSTEEKDPEALPEPLPPEEKQDASTPRVSRKSMRHSQFHPPKFALHDPWLENAGSNILIPPWEDGVVPFVSAWSRRCINWFYFDYIIGFVILLNSIFIGWQADAEIDDNSTPPVFITQFEPVFMSVYMLELTMRFLADGWRESVAKPWVRFDVFLVCLGTFSMVAVEHMEGLITAESGSGRETMLNALDMIMIVRVLRLLRLLRALRLFSQFKTLWRLVQGLMNSTGTMLSTLALLFFVIYVFGCIGVEMITKSHHINDHEETRVIVTEKFAHLPGVMLTLTQFVTMDSIAAIYRPIIDHNGWMVLYFLPIILIIPVALMNLVTAVLVEAAVAMATEDEEMAKRYRRAYLKEIAPEIHEAFKLLDNDGSGHITRDEVLHAKDKLPAVLAESIQADQVVEFFETLDMDGSGEISEAEFVEGVLNYLLSDVPVETQQSLKLLRMVKEKLVLLEEVVFKLPGAPAKKSAHAMHQVDDTQKPLELSTVIEAKMGTMLAKARRGARGSIGP